MLVLVRFWVMIKHNKRFRGNFHPIPSHALLPLFTVISLTVSITISAASDFGLESSSPILLPPLKKTLSPAGKRKAKALTLFALGCQEMRARRKMTPKAEKAFLDSLKLDPKSKCSLKILLAEWTLKKKPEVMAKKLLPIAKEHPEAVNLNLVVANTLRIINKPNEALRLLEKSFETVVGDANRDKASRELKSKLVFTLAGLLSELKKWNDGETMLDSAFADSELTDSLLARLGAARFFADCAEIGPDGFFSGWSRRRRKRRLLSNLAKIDILCSKTEVSAPTLLAVCKIYIRYSMPERATSLVLTQLLNNPNSSSSMLVLTKVFDNTKDYANEVRTWQTIIHCKKFKDIARAWRKANPGRNSTAELYFQLGLAAVKARNWSEAMAAFDWRLLNAPNDPGTVFQIGLVQMRIGKFRKALFHFDKLDKLPYALYFAALCHRSLKEYSQALDTIAKAEKLAKKLEFTTILTEGFYIDYAFIADKNGEFDLTRTILENLLKNKPDAPMLNNFLGYLLAEKGVDLGYAVKITKKALAKNPRNEAYLDTMAWALYKLNRISEAWSFMDEALDASGTLPDAVIAEHAGDIRLSMGDIRGALKYWRMAYGILSDNINYAKLAEKIKLAKAAMKILQVRN